MGLKENQIDFVRLSVDAALRKEAFPDEGSFLSGEFVSLEKEIKNHSRVLISKRLGAVKKILSMTNSFIGKDFSEGFRKLALSNCETQGVNRNRLDAFAVAILLSSPTRHGKYPPPLLALLTHETIPLRMWIERKKFFFQFHKRRPSELCRMIANRKCITTVPVKPAFLFWWEGNERNRGYFWREFSPWII